LSYCDLVEWCGWKIVGSFAFLVSVFGGWKNANVPAMCADFYTLIVGLGVKVMVKDCQKAN